MNKKLVGAWNKCVDSMKEAVSKRTLQEDFESHDCHRDRHDSCPACQEYYKLINK